MHESQHSEEVSFLGEFEQNHVAPIHVDNNFKKNPVFYFNRGGASKTTNRVVSVLEPNRPTGKLDFSEEFQDYLAQDEMNSNLNIVTFMGPRQVGKSFLIDFLVSRQEKSTSRQLSKAGKPYIHAPTYEVRGRNGEKIVYFDTNEDLPNDAFIWAYFLSATVVLNLIQGDRKGEEQFLTKLDSLRLSLDSDAEDLSLPQLIILRRDCDTKEFRDSALVKKIQDYGLFSSDIICLNMPYPGKSSDINSKDIKQVSQNLLSDSFISEAANLQRVLKSGKAKTIKGNFLGSKIAGLSLEPLTRSINKTGKASTGKIWTDVIETLSVGYYNYYIKKYQEELTKEFADEQPCDKYSLYKKLSKARRSVDKKVEGFANIAGDPTFEKYKEKLQEKINTKEKAAREINRQKSIVKNDEMCKRLFVEMNDSNCEGLIQKYCESKLDDQKAEVLLDNFETVVKRKLTEMEKSKNPALKPSTQIQQLEKELRQIEEQIENEKRGTTEVVGYDFNKLKAGIDQKEKEVKELEDELDRQKKLANEKKNNQNKDILELENNIEKLKAQTNDQEKQIQKLKTDKEAQAKQTVENLSKRLKEEEDRYQRLQGEVRKAQQVSTFAAEKGVAKKGTKDNCCNVM